MVWLKKSIKKCFVVTKCIIFAKKLKINKIDILVLTGVLLQQNAEKLITTEDSCAKRLY